MLTPLEQREIFHLAFMREFVRRVKPGTYAVKGGCALRFFYRSIRYSEDMDIDIVGIEVHKLKTAVMGLFASPSLALALNSYGIERIVPPDIKFAKQTETVQRFKVHLITCSGLNLFTKIEFSRRGFAGDIAASPVSDRVMSAYRQPPLVLSHYSAQSAVRQKVIAMASRAAPQARDAFDLYTLSSQIDGDSLRGSLKISRAKLESAEQALFSISYENYRDTVCSYLSDLDARSHARPKVWEEIQLAVLNILKGTK